MSVKIVTDSTSDLPKEIAEEFGITVVPANVHFGLETFRDGVDIQADQFYQRLLSGPVLPKTSAPSPGVFKECYGRLSRETHEIISIHISSKLSATYESALSGKRDIADCLIEVVDSRLTSMGLGLLAIAAAKAAKMGAKMTEISKLIQDCIKRITVVVALDTLDFLQKGGRIGKAQAWLGSMLSIKPFISLKEGEVIPLERVRTHAKSIARLYQLLEERLPAEEMAIVYSTGSDEAEKMMVHIKSIAPTQEAYLSRFGPGLGTHIGPGGLGIFVLK